MPLPVSYLERLRATEGVTLATHQSWFGGVYQDPSNFFAQMAVEPRVVPEDLPGVPVPPEQIAAWAADRQGAIVGVDLAKRFNWKVGDRIPITGTIWQPKDDGQTWEFNIVGMYDGEPGRGQDAVLLPLRLPRREPAAVATAWSAGTWSRSPTRSQAQAMGAKFDEMFANSAAETKTTTEKGFVEGFAKQIGDIGAIMIAILVAVLFTMLLVAANTMAQSVRERTNEVGVLKTLGFSNGSILALVLGESVLIALLGGAAGLGLAWLIVQQGDPTNGMLPIFVLPGRDVAVGAALIVAAGTGGRRPAGGHGDEPEDHRRAAARLSE